MAVIEKFQPRELGPKSWGTELVFAETPQYLGKVLTMRAGKGGPFQYHERKEESFFLLSGTAKLKYRTASGVDREVRMYAGEAYHVPCGAPHQVTAISDCVFVEVGLPVFEDRVAV
jgi:mannose-6-phosphate isomerase